MTWPVASTRVPCGRKMAGEGARNGRIRSDRRCGDRRPARPRGRAEAGEVGADGHTHETMLPQLRHLADRAHICACLRPEGPCPPVAPRLPVRLRRTACYNFEGKIWRTLPMLAWRPGEMTRRYIAGERARFISPVALYLFTVFAMFAVLNFTGALDPDAESFKAEIAGGDRRRPACAGEAGSQAQGRGDSEGRRWPNSIARSPSARRTSPTARRS